MGLEGARWDRILRGNGRGAAYCGRRGEARCTYTQIGRSKVYFLVMLNIKPYKIIPPVELTPASPGDAGDFQRCRRAGEGCRDRSRHLKLLSASGNLLESPKLKPKRVGERRTDSGGGWIMLKLLCDGRDVTYTREWVGRALRALELLLRINQALFSAPRVLTSLWVRRERNGWFHRESVIFPSIKNPTMGCGRGGAWRSHAATSRSASSESALSDKRARRNRHGEHS